MNTEEVYEVYAHDVYADIVHVRWEDDEVVPLYVVAGKDWDGAPFKIYLTQDEASSLLVQLGYQVHERNENGD